MVEIKQNQTKHDSFKLRLKTIWNKFYIGKGALYLSFIIIACSLIIGYITRLYNVSGYIQFWGDQARDSFVHAQMREGHWPTLGPGASIGGYSLPPSYYYLAFIFSFGSLDPVWQAFPNALFSFLSIPLLVYFILLLFDGFKSNRAWLVASFAGFWWSLFYYDIVFANVYWNPDSIPFFLLVFLILNKFGIEAILGSPKPDTKINLIRKILIWAGIGLTTSILVGLHSASLFTTLAALILIQLFLFYKRRLSAWPILSSWIVFLIVHIGYIYGEIGRGWTNTASLINLVLKPSTQSHIFFERLDRSIFSYIDLGNVAYFKSGEISTLASFFMGAVLVLALVKFKGDRVLWACSWLIWVIYSYSVSNYWGTIFLHYKPLIWFTPIIFSAVFLYYFKPKKPVESVLALLIIVCSIFSMYLNTKFAVRFFRNKHGLERIVTTYDMQNALQNLPDNTTLCTNETLDLSYRYIAKYNLSGIKIINFTQDCSQLQVAKIYYKFELHGDEKIYRTAPLDSSTIDKVLFENETLMMYQTKS